MSKSRQNPSNPRELKSTSHVSTLMVHYCLELQDQSAQSWIDRWLQDYSIQWVTLAVVEALYLGRYKAISVEQILINWKRRGQSCHHFTHEFERVISCRFPRSFRDFQRHPAKLGRSPTPASPTSRTAQKGEMSSGDSASTTVWSAHSALQLPVTSSDRETDFQVPLLNLPEPMTADSSSNPEPEAPTEPELQPESLGFTPFIRWRSLPTTYPWMAEPDLDSTPVLDEEPILQFVPNFVPDLAQTALFNKLKAISAVSSRSPERERDAEGASLNGATMPLASHPDPWTLP